MSRISEGIRSSHQPFLQANDDVSERGASLNKRGRDYRLSNILAALGRAQLVSLDQILGRRREIRNSYRQLFAGVPGVSLFDGGDDRSDNCWLTAIVVDDHVGWTAAHLSRRPDAEGIESRPLWNPMHRQLVFASAPSLVNGSSDWLFPQGLTLPSGSGQTTDDLDRVLTAVRTFVADR